jgi:hypothetical protein
VVAQHCFGTAEDLKGSFPGATRPHAFKDHQQ